jgi:hypothetical protein
VTFDFRTDNPGNWLFHCHNVYHLEEFGGTVAVEVFTDDVPLLRDSARRTASHFNGSFRI